jgi:hypothetical protein
MIEGLHLSGSKKKDLIHQGHGATVFIGCEAQEQTQAQKQTR